VDKFTVTWEKYTHANKDGFHIEVDITFKNDESHDPACCAYCQNVKTVWEIKNGTHKGEKSDPAKGTMHDDNYSRGRVVNGNVVGSDDLDGNTDLGNPDFKTRDYPGVLTWWQADDDDLDYSFTAEQIVKETCSPCPTAVGGIVAQRGPHTGTVKGVRPNRVWGGVPQTFQ
jgi:hypothetical protein